MDSFGCKADLLYERRRFCYTFRFILRCISKTRWLFFLFFMHRGNFLCTQAVPMRFNKVIVSDCYLSSKLSALEVWLSSRRVKMRRNTSFSAENKNIFHHACYSFQHLQQPVNALEGRLISHKRKTRMVRHIAKSSTFSIKT